MRGGVDLPGLELQCSDVVQSLRMVGLDTQHTLEMDFGFVFLFQCEQRAAEVTGAGDGHRDPVRAFQE